MLNITMTSPGKRTYRFPLEKTQEVVDLLKNKKEADKVLTRHLQLLKEDGLLPVKSLTQTQATTSNSQIEESIQVDDNDTDQDENSQSQITYGKKAQLTKPSMKACGSGLNLLQNNATNGLDPKTKRPLPKNAEEKTESKKKHKLLLSDVMKGENAAFIFQVEHEILVEVLKRPPLYNYRVELKYKSPDYVRSLYLEIANLIFEEMDVNVDSFTVENTWKHYYDLYNEYTNKAHKSNRSGSSGGKSPPLPKHYEVLSQIDNFHQKRNQSSSTSSEVYKLQPPQKRKKGNENANANNDEEIAPFLHTATNFLNNFNQTSTLAVTNNQPTPSLGDMIENDPDKSYLLTVLSDFRKLRNADKRQLKEDILIKVNRCLNNYDNENEN